jgi:hypothetical protein
MYVLLLGVECCLWRRVEVTPKRRRNAGADQAIQSRCQPSTTYYGGSACFGGRWRIAHATTWPGCNWGTISIYLFMIIRFTKKDFINLKLNILCWALFASCHLFWASVARSRRKNRLHARRPIWRIGGNRCKVCVTLSHDSCTVMLHLRNFFTGKPYGMTWRGHDLLAWREKIVGRKNSHAPVRNLPIPIPSSSGYGTTAVLNRRPERQGLVLRGGESGSMPLLGASRRAPQ